MSETTGVRPSLVAALALPGALTIAAWIACALSIASIRVLLPDYPAGWVVGYYLPLPGIPFLQVVVAPALGVSLAAIAVTALRTSRPPRWLIVAHCALAALVALGSSWEMFRAVKIAHAMGA